MKDRTYNILVFNFFIILLLNFSNGKNFKISSYFFLHHNFYKFYNIIYKYYLYNILFVYYIICIIIMIVFFIK